MLDCLTTEQKKAVSFREKSISLEAGAGSGKTRVLTERIRALLKDGIPSREILAITFTDKAKKEMEERLLARQDLGNVPLISTIHSFCATLLRLFPHIADVDPLFGILDGTGTRLLMEQIIREGMLAGLQKRDPHLQVLLSCFGYQQLKRVFQNTLENRNQWKEALLHLRKESYFEWSRRLPCGQEEENKLEQKCDALFNALVLWTETLEAHFKREKEGRALLTFEDLQVLALRLLLTPGFSLMDRWRYVLVDEFQDVDLLQKELIDCMKCEERGGNLFIVGDPKQAIYGFRGADVSLFQQTENAIYASGGEKLCLTVNFRASAPLVSWTNALASSLFGETTVFMKAKEPSRGQGVWWTRNQEGRFGNKKEERGLHALEGVGLIKGMVAEGLGDFGDFALLFRSMGVAPYFEEKLAAQNIPSFTVAGKGFFETAETQELLSILRVLRDPTDALSLYLALSSSFFGVAEETLFKLFIGTEGKSFPFEQMGEFFEFLEENQKLRFAFSCLNTWRDESVRIPVDEMLFRIIGQNPSCPQANFEKWIGIASAFPAEDIESFLASVEELEDQGLDSSPVQLESLSKGAVKLMTVHQAKGLEFPIVMLPELDHRPPVQTLPCLFDRKLGVGIAIPDPFGERYRSCGYRYLQEKIQAREREESKRLLYVAVTRAKRHLVLPNLWVEEAEPHSWRSWLLPFAEREEAGEWRAHA